MDRSESSQKLITEETDLGYTNECSSGYDSGSDNESATPIHKATDQSLLDKAWKEQSHRATKEKMNYQNTQDLSSHLRYIMSMPELCDVVFIVGSKRIPVYGVKAIMGARSRVIYNIILKKQRELEFQDKSQRKINKNRKKSKIADHHLVIGVNKYLPEDFQKIIEYLHCGSVDISTTNLAGLLCGASQFELDDLTRACWEFIGRCSSIGSICLLIPAARHYSQHTTGKALLSWIADHISRTTVV